MDSGQISSIFLKRRVSLSPASVALIAFLLSALLFGVLTVAEYRKQISEQRAAMANYGNMLSARIDRELNAVMLISGGLSSYLTVYRNELDPRKLEAILANLYTHGKYLRCLDVVEGYRITYVYPQESNEAALGVDLRMQPDQWPLVKLAADTRRGVLAGPLNLIQGGKGIIYRYPVYMGEQYWGQLFTVINADELLKAAFEGVPTDNYTFAVRVQGTPDVFYGNPALFAASDSIIVTSQVPSGSWEWVIHQTRPDIPKLIFMIAGMGLAISLLLSRLAYRLMDEHQRIVAYAMYDSLTGLANRRLLQDRMHRAYAQAKRFHRSMAVIYVDLDHFKGINDTYGHQFGDEYLKAAGQKLESCLRSIDTLSRTGGDEFIIVLDEISSPQDARAVADNILEKFRQPATINGSNVSIELSMGVAVLVAGSNVSLHELIKQADQALYQAKTAGRNTYRVFGEDFEPDEKQADDAPWS